MPVLRHLPLETPGGHNQDSIRTTVGQSERPAMKMTYESLAKRVDHSLLGPSLTEAELEQGCRIATLYDVASVCIKPFAVAMAAKLLAGSDVRVGTTIGFPHGGHALHIKLLESRQAIGDGATELDMVVNIGKVLGGRWDEVRAEIAAVADIAHSTGGIIKVIFENCYLSDDHKLRLCQVCGEARSDYVKTSTGYGTGGATHADILLMREAAPDSVKVKAAGGIRDLDAAIGFVDLGCDRLGLSKTAEILDAWLQRLGLPPRQREVPRGTGDRSTTGSVDSY
jgi:deoxyribose-phosphate aldolase